MSYAGFVLLTDSKIRNAKPRAKPYKLSDGERLTLLVKPNGSRLWHFRYEFAGKEKTLSIGKYPGISLADAREEKRTAKQQLRKNIDPSAKKQQEKSLAAYKYKNTLEQVARQWHGDRITRWSKTYATKTLRRLEIHVFPFLGSRVISSVEKIEILDVVRKIEQKGMTETSHRVLGLLQEIFNFASIFVENMEHNPASGLSKYLLPHEETHLPKIDEQEIPTFLAALDKVENVSDQERVATWVLLLTLVRTCELRYSRKTDVFLERKKWVLRPEVTKMKREHIVSLSDQAVIALGILIDIAGDSEWLVPALRSRKHAVLNENAINRVIHKMGYKGRIVGHGFRALFSTTLNDHGFNNKIVDRQLAHVGKDKIEAAYNRAEYEEQRREIMQWWGNYLDEKRPNKKRFCPERFESQGVNVQGSFASLTNRVMDFSFNGVSSNDETEKKVAILTSSQQLVHNFQTVY